MPLLFTFNLLSAMKKSVLATLLLLVLVGWRLHAQVTSFPENPNEFVDKLDQFMNASKRPDMAEAFAVFQKQYRGGMYAANEMAAVVRVCNLLADQRLGAFPYYKSYINALTAAKAQGDSTLFQQWHSYLETAIAAVEKGRTKPIGQLLDFSADFFGQRAFWAREAGLIVWTVRGGKVSFVFENQMPALHCQNIDLVGLRKNDSTVIQNTSGFYFPYEETWRGSGGKITWARAGLDTSVYARLTNYTVEAKKPLFTCDSAEFFYPLLFPNRSLWGKVEENVIILTKASTIEYPKFESFERTLKITRIGQGIEYEGGFRMEGKSVYGYGTNQQPARLTVYNNKRQKIFYGVGELFIIRREEVVLAEGISARLFMDKDSIYHPAVNFRLDIPSQVIHLTRGQKGPERNPFFSSFYNMNLNAEKIAWHILKDSLEVSSSVAGIKSAANKVEFESSNRFDPGEYLRMQNITSVNPIAVLHRLAEETPWDSTRMTKIISDDAFARALDPKFDYSNIQTLLAEMVAQGFINYHFKRHEIEPRPKLMLYALASQGKRDYDAIKIVAKDSLNAGAVLDLKTKETSLNGVSSVELSERQRVGIVPRGGLTLLQNRDMRMSGRLFAGFGVFEGDSMYFSYEKFHVEFDSVRSLHFYLPTGAVNDKGKPIAESMNSVVEKVSGVLLVDAPNNKSGKVDIDIFPSLESKKYSFVFYDAPTILEGVYKRDSFYFRLDPFTFNGLDSYTRDRLRFKGEMTSAEIFEPFRETIVVREHDRSFGFIHQTPPKGYPVYQRRGNYTGKIDLSNSGFLGIGTVEYLTADIESEDIVFRPRQMTCTARRFFMEEDRKSEVKVPQAKGEDVKVNWLPYRDSMYVESRAKAFELFRQPGYYHKGVLVLTPSGLKGRGEFDWFGGRLTARVISYGPFQASSDTADLQIKALDGQGVVFDSRNVRGELDFDRQLGEFKANTADASTDLPLNRYRTSMNEFTWDMKGQTVTFKSDEREPGYFVSTDPKQDTLNFRGKTALYDMRNSRLKVGGVEVIKSADAFIYPSDGNVDVDPGGVMRPLSEARIVADTSNKYHTINRATVTILGRKEYKASGYYEYSLPGRQQEVFFNNIVGEHYGPGTPATKKVLTTASGDVRASDSFYIDTKTLFAGTVILKANQQNLRFEGLAKIQTNFTEVPWFSIYSDVDKNNPIIRVTKVKDGNGEPLFVGFFQSRETGQLYPSLLQPPTSVLDRVLFNGEGFFRYEQQADRFLFGDSARVFSASQLRGAKLTYDNRTGTFSAEGPIQLGQGLEFMKIKGAGRLKTEFNIPDTVAYTITGELMTGIEVTVPKVLVDLMLNDIRASSFDAPVPPFNSQQAFYRSALSEFVSDSADLAEALNNLNSNFLNLPRKDNKYTFVLGRHPVIWNPEYQSFLSLEDRLPLVSIAGEPIQKMLTGYVEYKMPGNRDDRFYLYIKASADLWYFFGYQAGALNVVSSSTRFNDALLALKPKDTQLKMPNGEVYEIVAANPALADAFVNRVRSGRKF